MLKNTVPITLAIIWYVTSAIAADNPPTAHPPERIYIQESRFNLNGHPIYLNGANTPFHNWDEFGAIDRRYGYRHNWWEAEFIRLKEAGINSIRVWISCSGTNLPDITPYGYVTGVNKQFWQDVDRLMQLARQHKIYIMATMMSFDHTKEKPTSADPQFHFLRWRQMFTSEDRIQAMIDSYLLPFVLRYRDNPYLFAIDLCNEPEWMNQNDNCGNIPWTQLQQWAAMSAAAIHQSGSKVLVTMGSACVKWNSNSYEENHWGDQALQARYPDAKAYLDFYQIHYYLWMEPWFPLLRSPADHGLNDRPLVMGEMPAHDGPKVFPPGVSMAQAFESFLSTGYGGHYPWTSNGVDHQGSLADFKAAALAFQQSHSNVVQLASMVPKKQD